MVKSAQHLITTWLAHEMFAYVNWTAKSNTMTQAAVESCIHPYQPTFSIASNMNFTYASADMRKAVSTAHLAAHAIFHQDRAVPCCIETYFFAWSILISSCTCCDVLYWAAHRHYLLTETILSPYPITPCAITSTRSIVGLYYSITCTKNDLTSVRYLIVH